MKLKFGGPFSNFVDLFNGLWLREAWAWAWTWTWTFLAHNTCMLAKRSTIFSHTRMKLKFGGPFSKFVDLFNGS